MVLCEMAHESLQRSRPILLCLGRQAHQKLVLGTDQLCEELMCLRARPYRLNEIV